MTYEQTVERVKTLEVDVQQFADLSPTVRSGALRAWLEHLSTDDRQLVQAYLRHHLFPAFTESHDETKLAAEQRVRRARRTEPIEVTMVGDEYPFGAAVTTIGGPFGADPEGILEVDDGVIDQDGPPLRAAIREAYAAGRAHAAAQTAAPGIKLNVVIDFADAARTFAYHGLRALARRIERLADRIVPAR